MRREGPTHDRTRADTLLIMAAAAWLAACGGEPEAAATRDEAAVHGFDLATLEEVFDQEGASLGSVAFPVSCSDEAAESMRRGLALLHNMTFVEAEGAFRSASEQDPDCALAYWGMAMTYLHPLWPDVPSTESFERGWDLLQEARSRGLGTEREEGYVTALEAYYRDGPNRDEPSRLASYAEAWAAVHAEHPDDPEAALFRALSLLATAPGSDQSFATQREAGAMAEAVLAAIPDHPGAHHYVIHAYDVPPLAEEALPAARSYGKVAPENAHALHMTSHIFTRVGSWEESIDYNVRSADAAARHPINGATSHHHLHAVDYLAYAYLQRGQNDRAEEILRHLEALDGPVFDHAASAYAFAAVPSRIALETHDWSRAAAVETDWPSQVAWERYPHLAAIPEFARALGSARTGDLSAAEAAIARLSQLEAEARALPQSYDWGTQVKIQELGARAWLAYAQGRADQALALMTEAADLEAGSTKNPVTPGEVLPAMELLGDLLLDLGQYAEAQQAYERALTRSPNRFNSLYGAGRAAQLQGDDQAAGEYYRHLHSVVAEDATGRSELEATREFLKG